MKIYKIILLLILFAFPTIYSQDFWERTNGLDTINIYSLAINSNGDIFAGTKSSGLFRSTDNGNSWTNLGFNSAWIHGNGIVISPTQEILLAIDNQDATGGVFRSNNNGNNWDTLGLTFNAEITIALNSSGNIFVGTAAQGVYRSTDNGLNFIQINEGLNDSSLSPVSFSINDTGHIFVGTVSGGGVFRSTDNGDNWVQINQGITNYKILSLRTNSSGTVFAGTEGGGIFRSINNGENWVQINQGLFGQNGQGYYVFSLAINSSGDIFAGTGDGVFRSTDNGNNWVEINGGLTSTGVLSLAINASEVKYAGTLDGVFRSTISAKIKVLLEGPYNGAAAMTTTLNTNNLIPLNSNAAYSIATYDYTESTVGSIPFPDIVDWVLVELRTGTASGTKVATRAAFLKSDGTIVDIDGISPVHFSTLSDGNYYIVIRHRNHLAIMSASAISLSRNSVLYDFTTAQLQAYGTNPMKSLSGVYSMISGDASSDGQVNVDDRNATWNNKNLVGFRIDDVTLDGQVNVDDRNATWNNKNLSTQIP